MLQVLKIIVQNCELAVRRDAEGIQLAARGPIAVIAAIAIMYLVARGWQ